MAKNTASVAYLKPNPRNPRKVTKAKLSMLQKSMAKFGDLGGIVFNRQSGQLVGGHQRKEAFLALKADDITIERTFDPPTEAGTVAEGFVDLNGERFSYRETDWPADMEAAANLAANRGAGDFDMPMLADMMSELDTSGFENMDLTMFDAQERASLLDNIEQGADGGDGGDGDPVELPADPTTKLGDIYSLGRHRLMCGSCTSTTDVDALLRDEQMDITFTSPPYNQAKNSHMNGRVKGFDLKYQDNADALSDDDYCQLLADFTALSIVRSDYVFVNLQLLAHNKRSLIRYQYSHVDFIKDILIWNKLQCPPNIVKGAFNTKWEYIFCFSKNAKTRGFPCEWQGKYPNVVETESNSGNDHAENHKAGFPIAFPIWFLDKFDFAMKIYEPFAGTGTTLCAAEKMNRTCFAMELDPRYCDIIVARWEKLTGQKAELLPREE